MKRLRREETVPPKMSEPPESKVKKSSMTPLPRHSSVTSDVKTSHMFLQAQKRESSSALPRTPLPAIFPELAVQGQQGKKRGIGDYGYDMNDVDEVKVYVEALELGLRILTE